MWDAGLRSRTLRFPSASAFSFWLIAGAGYAAVHQGVLFLFAGIPVCAWLQRRKREPAGETSTPSV